MNNTYIYRRLPSMTATRVLELEPSKDFNAALSCSLHEIYLLDDPRPYKALSYVWGLPKGDIPVHCEGKTILITPNCEEALRYLRHKKHVVTLWVDAICIDQQSIPERNVQVPIMWAVYDQAEEVVIWLGAGDGKRRRALPCLRRVARASYIHDRMKLPGWCMTVAISLACASVDKDAIYDILSHQWFYRVWTVQELVYAAKPRIQYGRQTIQWHEYARSVLKVQDGAIFRGTAIKWIMFKALQSIPFDRNNLRNNAPLGAAYSEGESERILDYTFLLMLSFIYTCDCQDPRDKVYGLYNLLHFEESDSLETDYSKPIAMVFEEFTKYVISQTRRLTILNFYLPTRSSSEKATWVPNYEYSQGYEALDRAFLNHSSSFQRLLVLKGLLEDSATKFSRVCTKLLRRSKRGELLLTGYLVSKIKKQSVRFPEISWHTMLAGGADSPFPRAQLDCLAHWIRFAKQLKKYPGGLSAFSAFEYLLNRHLVQDIAHQQGLNIGLKHAWEQDGDTIMLFISPEGVKWHDLGSWIALERRVLFLTETGHLGISQGDLEIEDLVVLLSGSDFPIILRKAGEYYRFMGPAIVAGMMRGEEWPCDGNSTDKLSTFALI